MLSTIRLRSISSFKRLISRNFDFRISIYHSYHTNRNLLVVENTLDNVQLLCDPKSNELFKTLIINERNRVSSSNSLKNTCHDHRLGKIWRSILRSQQYDAEFDPVNQLVIEGNTTKALDLFSLYVVYWKYLNSRCQVLSCLSKLLVSLESPLDIKPFLRELIIHAFSDKQLQQFITVNSIMNESGDYEPEKIREFACQQLDEMTDPSRFQTLMANTLVTMSTTCTTSLVGSSVCLRFLENGIRMTDKTLYRLLTALTIDTPSRSPFQLKAISILLTRLSTHKIEDYSDIFTSSLKRKIMDVGINAAKLYSSPTIAQEIFDQISNLGAPVPLLSCYDLIQLHFSHEFINEAASIWQYVTKNYVHEDIISVEMPIISFLILRMSKFKQTMHGAREIAEAIFPESYKLEGITEALLIYCSRDRNIELAQKIYSHLIGPFRRSVLTALLRLHLSYGDDAGADRIINHIVKKEGKLLPEEISYIANHMESQKPEEGVKYLLSKPFGYDIQSLHKGLGTLISRHSNLEIEKKYMKDLLTSSSLDVRRLACSIVLSRLCYSGKPAIARHFWQRWAIKEDIQARGSRILLNSMLHGILYTKSKLIFPWLCWRYRDLGVSFGQVEGMIKESKRLSEKKKRRWISSLRNVYSKVL